MSTLFDILDGIVSSDYATETLSSAHEVQNYAEGAGQNITLAEAERIATVGLRWLDDQRNGNGEWSRMRHEAKNALQD
jgi:hypothetical protein